MKKMIALLSLASGLVFGAELIPAPKLPPIAYNIVYTCKSPRLASNGGYSIQIEKVDLLAQLVVRVDEVSRKEGTQHIGTYIARQFQMKDRLALKGDGFKMSIQTDGIPRKDGFRHMASFVAKDSENREVHEGDLVCLSVGGAKK